MIIRTLHDAQIAARTLRLAAGLTQAALADRLHVSHSTLAARENGQTGLTVGALADIAAELGHQLVLSPAQPGSDDCCQHCRNVVTIINARQRVRLHQGVGSPFAVLYDAIAAALGRRS